MGEDDDKEGDRKGDKEGDRKEGKEGDRKGRNEGDRKGDKDGDRKGGKEGDRKEPKGPRDSEEKDDVMPTGMPDDSAEKDEEIKDLKRALVAFLKRGDEKVDKNEGGDRKEAKEGDRKGDKMSQKGEGKENKQEDKEGNRKEGKEGEKEGDRKGDKGDRKGPKRPKGSEEKDDVMPTGMPEDRAEKDEEMKDLKRALVAFLKREDGKKEVKEGGRNQSKGDKKTVKMM